MALPDDNDWDWYGEASCKDAPIDIFFPPRDKEKYADLSAQGKAYCFGDETRQPCPVRLRCLWQAINTDEQHGIWGGMSHRERNALVRKWQKQFKNEMTLKEYVFQMRKGDKNGQNKQRRT